MIQGYLDSVSDGFLHGWAHDPGRSGPSVTVYCNGSPIGSAVANVFRPDLAQAGIGDGKHGFAFALPGGLDGDLTAAVNGAALHGRFRAPSLLSEFGPHVRRKLAREYLRGEGLEVGALDKPMWVPEGVRLRTVDRLPTEELRRHYGIPDAVPVDYVSDAEKLETVPADSQDFVIANHVFEHMQNPLAALENWLRVVRAGGLVFMAIPDQRFTFDRDRTVTPLEHIAEEHQYPERVSLNRAGHYQEWIRDVEHQAGDVSERLQALMQSEYSIHFHCWTALGLMELFASRQRVFGFEIDCYKFNRPECIFILLKTAKP